MNLTICELNAENLFVSMDFYAGQDLETLHEDDWKRLALSQFRKKQKPIAKLWGLSKAILDIDPDIVLLIEVGGAESLANFNRHFLKDRYASHFIEGNSRRNIDLAFLVKRGLPLRVEARSNKDAPVEVNTMQGKYVSRFSRDLAELRLHDDSGEKESLRLIILLTHLKSMLSTEKDYKGKDVRTAEAAALASFYENLRRTLPGVPIVVGGDFNSSLSSLELELLNRTDLTDFHDCLQTPPEGRVSLIHFGHKDDPHELVLDYLLVSPELKDRVVAERSYTYRYKGFHDIPEPLPKRPRERYQMPSDHYPLVLTLNLRIRAP